MSKEALESHLSTAYGQVGVGSGVLEWLYPLKDDQWCWNCEFCDALLMRWTDRVAHIGGHFNGGTTMSSWDPLMPPHPLDRTTMKRVGCSPKEGWNVAPMRNLEHSRPSKLLTSSPEAQYRCEHYGTDVYFTSEKDCKRHEEIWHSWRVV